MTPRGWGAIGAVVALAAWWAWPSDRARVRETLDRLAEAASAPSGDAPLAAVGRAARLSALLAPDVRISLGEPGLQLEGRDAALAAATRLAAALAPLDVTIAGADITVQHTVAHARVTVQVATPSRPAQRYDGEELVIDLSKRSSDWLVTRVTLARALTKPEDHVRGAVSQSGGFARPNVD